MTKSSSQAKQNFTPASVRKRLTLLIQKWTCSVEKIQQNPIADFVLTIFLAGIYASFYLLVTLNPDLGDNRTTFFDSRYFWIIPAAVPIILLSELAMKWLRISKHFLMLACFASVFCFLPYILTYASASYVPAIVRYSMIFVIASHLLIFRLTRGLSYSTRLIIYILLELGLVFFLDAMAFGGFYGLSFWITHPYRYIFTFTMLAADEVTKKKNLSYDARLFSYVLNPTNWITPLPIRYEDWKPSEQIRQLRAKGTVYLLITFFVLLACAYIQKYRNFLYAFGISPRWLFSGGATYLFYFCFSYSNINIPVSIAWRFGFKIPEPYDFPLLATSPQDRWRRWNFYFYDWYFRSVFFPIFKKTQSYFAAVMSSFLVTLFIHLGSHNSEFIMVSLGVEDFTRQMYKKTIFFFAHGLLVYLGMRFQKFIPDENKSSGWLAVLLMFAIMSVIHHIFTL